MTVLVQCRSMLRHAIGLAPLIVLAIGRAEAACDPASPVNNVTVTCTGTTLDASGTNGYGTATDMGNTYNIVAGASVLGTGNGLRFGDLGTVNNAGAIRAQNGEGVFGTFNGTVNNSGDISSTLRSGVRFFATGIVNNSGSITGGVLNGVDLQNGEVTNTSTGIISGGIAGVDIRDEARVSNAGAIIGGEVGVRAESISGTVAEISNTGRIEGGSIGIQSSRLKLANSGEITGNGSGGGGILGGVVEVANGVTGIISAEDVNGIAISAETAVVANAGTIEGGALGISTFGTTLSATVNNAATGNISGGQNGIDVGNGVVINAGTISAGGVAVNFRSGGTINNSGTVSGRIVAVSGSAVEVANGFTGIISAEDVNGIGIRADTAVVANAGTIRAGGATGVGIDISGHASINNAATGNISGGLSGIVVGNGAVANAGTISGGLESAVFFRRAGPSTTRARFRAWWPSLALTR